MAFATYSRLPAGSEDDHLAVRALEALGVAATPAVWDDPAVEWAEFDAVVLRSTWDYFLRPDQFAFWLESTARVSTVWNPPEMVAWNAHKGYLLDLAAQGIDVVPTELVAGPEPESLGQLLRRRGWSGAVVKPAIGGNAEGLRKVAEPVTPEDETHFRKLRANGEVLVQPLLADVRTRGERSLVFLGGTFSHAARYPFVLEGGSRTGEAVDPEPEVLARAERLVRGLASVPLYARVDLLPADGGGWVLSELELIEPDLFLRIDPASARRFAEALRSRLERPGAGARR